ncbi:hypothetical protein T11_3634 [Trichinella zimbabwensis]|uniref:Uncharacterized protein n=1 Tax=Trichinella zimbabwensis TaxID=268475 RepID=A0A0V1GJU4_9BILA|nr:hypothetical protein T11_3634 [Trichinella zimbabwensis]
MENSKKQEKDKGRKQLRARPKPCTIVGKKRHQVVRKMAEFFVGIRHRARPEVTEVNVGKMTIHQTNRGAVGSDTTKTGYNCKGEKGTGPYKKRLRCLAEKLNRAEQEGEQLMRGNRQPVGQ